MERTFHYLNHPSNQRNSFNNLQRELEDWVETKKDIEEPPVLSTAASDA